MDYLTVTQAAAELGLTERGVRHRIERGEMAAERINPRLLLVPRAEVERWRARGKQRPGRRPRYTNDAHNSEGEPTEKTSRMVE